MATQKSTVFKHKEDYLPVAYSVLIFSLQIAAYLWLPVFWICVSVPFFAISLYPVLVFNHHHQHNNTFRIKWLNRLFEMQMHFQTGIAPFGWVLHHNFGHHPLYLNQHPEKDYDPSAWTNSNGQKLGVISYCFQSLLSAGRETFRIGKIRPNILKKWKKYVVVHNIINLFLVLINPIPGLILFFGIGWVIILLTFLETYFHHVGLYTKNDHEASYNYLGKFYNFITCNLGYHTAHHINPHLHWSKLPEFHETIKDKIPEHCYMKSRWKFLIENMNKEFSLKTKEETS